MSCQCQRFARRTLKHLTKEWVRLAVCQSSQAVFLGQFGLTEVSKPSDACKPGEKGTVTRPELSGGHSESSVIFVHENENGEK